MNKRLGKGFAEIIQASVQASPNCVLLQVEQIRPSRFQPRQVFAPEALEELKSSIKQRGVIQPIIVRPIAHGTYELVAGERRWRAAKALGLREIPALIRALSDQETLEHSILENVQRENLNPLEEAKGFARLINEFGYTQEAVAEALGKNRSSVANALRLLKLPEEIQHAISEGKLTAGHAKALLMLEDVAKQRALFQDALGKQLSVRQLESLAADARPASSRRRPAAADPHLQAVEQSLRALLGTKVRLSPRARGGRIVIDYFSTEELSRIAQAMGLTAGA
ncbi:MAG: ParB/RepB/Spo0J family partition protein [Candidatus Omnitrophica bacterium]|nr:ParB/RepB/Spo0J family partition protein [Candidatus Omnitrophota bacterium]